MLASHDQLALQVFRPRTTIEPDGTVEGYASLFGELDAARDIVMPGAFSRTLKSRGLRRIPMLFQHDPAEPVGVWLELVEDVRGLRARGRLIPEVARGRELYALVTSGAVDGLSIGFRTVKGRIDPATRVRRIVDLELWEISIVTFPLLAGARVRAVKALSSPTPSLARARAEQEWAAMRGTRALPRMRHAAIDLAPRRLKYSPNQPRVPGGNPDGGQWTNGGGGNNVSLARTRLADAGNRVARPIQTVLSDATPDPILPGAQYAQNVSSDSTARLRRTPTDVVLPDGSKVPDESSPSGYLRSPVTDLSPVARAGRETGETYRRLLEDSRTAPGAFGFLVASLGGAVGIGGKFDYQREGNRITGYTPFQQYRNVSNFNVGLYSQQVGLSLDETLRITGTYASFFSSNAAPAEPYGVDAKNRKFIEKGFRAGASGVFEPTR